MISRHSTLDRLTALALIHALAATSVWSGMPAARAAGPASALRPARTLAAPPLASLGLGRAEVPGPDRVRDDEDRHRKGPHSRRGSHSGRALHPVVECVSREGLFHWTARFGYRNDDARPVDVAVGARNFVAPGPPAQGQPTRFEPGRSPLSAAFAVPFSGLVPVAWALRGPDGKTRVALATVFSERCSAPPPPPPPAPACQTVFFGPQRFERNGCGRDGYRARIDVPASVPGPYLLRVSNGAANGSQRVSSAWIKVDGDAVFGPSDFNPNVGASERVAPLSAGERSRLDVVLSGKPGSYLTVEACGGGGDATPPVVSLVHPAAGAVIADPRPTLRVAYDDPGGAGQVAGSGVDPATLAVLVDGEDRSALFVRQSNEASAAWPEELAFAPGVHDLEIAVADRAGNRRQYQASFTVDVEPPSLARLEPAEFVADSQPIIRLSFADTQGLAADSLQVRIDGEERTSWFTVGDGEASGQPPAALAAGAHVLAASIRDQAGNVATVEGAFVVDLQSPTLEVGQPRDGARLGTDLVELIVRFGDDQAVDPASFAATLDGAPATLSVGPDGAMGFAGPLADGAHRFEARIRDRAGREAAAGVSFSVDRTRPALEVFEPAPGLVTRDAAPEVVIRYADAEGLDLSTFTAAIGGVPRTSLFSVGENEARAILVESTRLPEGAVEIDAEIADLAGNRATARASITVDTVTPRAAMLAPPQAVPSNAPRPEIRLELEDPAPGTGVEPASVRIRIDGVDATSAFVVSGSAAIGSPEAALGEGAHAVEVTLQDGAGNQTTAPFVFSLDLTAPAIERVAPAAAFVASADPEVGFGLVDAGAGVEPGSVVVRLGSPSLPERDVTSDFAVECADGACSVRGVVASGLADGSHRFTVRVADRAGNFAEDSVTFEVDTVAPTLFVEAPALDAFLPSGRPELRLRYADERSGVDVARVELRVDGIDRNALLTPGAELATGGLAPEGEPLADGPHTFEVVAHDRAGNASETLTQSFVVDTVAPAVAAIAPPPGAWLGTGTPELRFGWSDGGSGLDLPWTRLAIDGLGQADLAPQADGLAFTTPSLADGAHEARVEIRDLAGNVAQASVAFRVDTVAPRVPELEAGDDGWYGEVDAEGRGTVSGRVSDLDPNVRLECLVGGVPSSSCSCSAVATDGAFSCSVPLAEGDNDVEIRARDAAGNETRTERSLRLDTVAPTLEIRAPAPESVTSSGAVEVEVEVTDASPVTVSVAGLEGLAAGCVGASPARCTFQVADVPVGAGPFATLTATATDAAGHTGTGSVRLRVDRDAPRVSVAQPPAGAFTRGAAVDVSGTVTDASAVLVDVNGIPATVGGGGTFSGEALTWSFQATVPVVDGASSIVVTAFDEAGLSGTATRTVTVDSAPPALAITAPVPGLVIRAPSLEVAGTVADATAVSVTVDGVPAAVDGGAFALTVSLAAEGPRTFVVQATDAAGNVSTRSVSVVVDRTPPSLVIAAPDEGAAVLALPLPVSGTTSDATDVVVMVNGIEAVVDGAAWSASVSPAEGRQAIEVVAVDGAGNEARVVRQVLVDLAPPELVVSAPAPGLLTREENVVAGGTVRDTSVVAVTVNGIAAPLTGADGGACPSPCAFTAPVALPEGDSTVLVAATDEAGRVAEFAIPVTRDSTPPVLALTTPETISGARAGQAVASLADGMALESGRLEARISAGCALGVVDGTGPSLVLALAVPDCASAGDTIAVTLSATDRAGNSATLSRAVRVVADGAIAGQVLDATTGLPLPSVEVHVAGAPSAPDPPVAVTDAAGRYALPASDPRVVVRLVKAGYTAVERVVEVASGEGTVAVDAFLTPLAAPVIVDAPSGLVHVHVPRAAADDASDEDGGTCTGTDCAPSPVRLSVPAGTYPITGLSPQALPGLLPLGWSAVAAFELGPPTPPSTVTVEGLSGAVHLVRYSPERHAWVLEQASVAATVGLPGAGSYALVVADGVEPPLAVPAVGEVIEGLGMVPLSAVAASEGSVTPPVIPPTGGTATGSIRISGVEGVPSGTVVQASVVETYTLASEEQQASTEPRTFDIVVARERSVLVPADPDPCTAPDGALCAEFPITPSRSYAPAELTEGRVRLDILAGREGVRGSVGGGSQAVTLTAGDLAVSVAQGALVDDLALAVEQHALSSFLPANAGLVPLAELSFDASGATLGTAAQVTVAAAIAAGDSAVLAKVERADGIPYLLVVAAFDIEAERVVSRSVPGLPGLHEGGRYVVYRIAGPVAFVTGTTTAASAPVQARVTNDALPFHAYTRADGHYAIAVIPGSRVLTATVPGTSLLGTASVQAPAEAAVPIALQGVVTTASVTPADGAVALAPTTSVTIESQAPIAASSLTAEAVRLVDDVTEARVALRFVLSTSGRTLSVVPQQSLGFATRYRLEAPGLRDTFGGLVQVPVTRFTTRADTPPQYDLAAIRFGYPGEAGLVQVTAQPGTLPPGTEILIINAGNGAVVTFTAENDGSLGTTFPTELPATISDTLYVTVTDPLGNVTTFTRSEYVAEDGTTGIGPGGGTVRGEGGVELRVPEGALKKGVSIRIEGLTVAELEQLFPGQRPPTGTLGSGLRIDSADKPTFDREADLAFPRPAGAPDGAFYYVYRRIEGPEGRVLWETLDHAFLEGTGESAKVVTASYPFGGYRNSIAGVDWSVGGAAAINAAVTNYAFLMWTFDELLPGLPLPGAVTGQVLRARHGGLDGTAFDPVPVAVVSRLGAGDLPLYRGEGSVSVALSQPDGRFTLWDGQYTGGEIRVGAEADGEIRVGTAFDANPLDSKSTGLRYYQNVATVNLTFPALEPPPPPPAVEIVARTVEDGAEVGTSVVLGRALAVDVRATFPVLALLIGGAEQTLVRDAQNESHTSIQDPFVVAGSDPVTIAVVVQNGFGQAETVTRVIRVLAPGVGSSPRPGEVPVVLAPISPPDRATRVPTTTAIEIQFSEPVVNVRDVASGLQSVHLEELRVVDGSVVESVPMDVVGITADGAVVEPLDQGGVPVVAVSLVPRRGLKGGITYRVRLDPTIVDLDDEPQPLTAFASRFTTFGPSEFPTDPIGAELASPGVAAIDGRAYMVGIHPGGALQGEVRGWDLADPLAPRLLGGRTIVTHRPLDIVGEGDNPVAGGGRLVVVATGPNSRSRPSNVYAIDVSEDGAFRWIGAATLSSSALEGFVTRLALAERSLYATTVRKGIQVVDLERARDQFQAVGGPLGLLRGGRPVTQPFNTDGEGWGHEAVRLTIPVPPKPSGAHYYLGDLAVASLAGVPHVFVASEAGLLVADVGQAELVYPPAFTQQPAGVPAPLSAPDGTALHWARAIAFATLSGRDTVVVVGDDSAGQASLFTVDVSDPAAPRMLGHVDLGLDGTGLVPVDVLVADETAIVGTQSSSGQGRTLYVSVSDPDAPLVTTSLDGPGGHLAIVSDGLLVSTARSAFGGTTPLTGLRLTALDPVTATGATSCVGSVDLWTPRVLVQKTIDRVNGVSCSDPGRIAFVVCKPSRVSLLLEGSPLVASLDGAPETPLTDLALAPGLYVAHVSAAGLGDLKQPLSFEVKGVPDDGGAPDVRPGVIELDVLNRAVLPVGRTFVKGVDLLDGHLVQQSTDLSLPGRHLGLQVTRTYSNSGPRPDGAMGPGWSWNFDAGLDETSCGLVNVSTADGSNQVFRTTDGGQTFVPQKGYHGSLRQTPAGLYVYTDKAAVEHTFEPVGGSIDPESYRLARVVEPHGDRLELSYDGRRRLNKVTERHAEKLQPVRTLEVSYVQAGGYERVEEIVVKGPAGRSLGLAIRYHHDPVTGNLESVTRSGENLPGGPPAEPRTESYEYEPSGQGLAGWRTRHRLKAAIDANGNRVEYEFFTLDDDFPGPPTLEIVDQDQFVKRVRERAASDVEYETRFGYDFSRATTDQQWVTTVTDARQNDTVYVLNGNGSPTEVREPLGRTTKAGWAANDVLKEWEEDPNQRVTRFAYDARGNVTSETIETADLGIVETAYAYHPRFNKLTLKRDPELRETTYGVDETSGDLRFVTDAVGNVTEHRYDAHGQLQVSVSPRGFETLYSDFHPITGSPRRVVDAAGNSTTSVFDDRGRLLAVSDSMGRRSTTTHDGLDRPTLVARAALYGQPDERTVTTYFPGGQPRQVTTAAGLATEFTLDGLNRLTRTEIRVPGVAGFPAEPLVSTREYDGNGNVVVETDRRGVRERNVYDALNRLEATVLESGPDSGPVGEVARFTYDAVGNKRTETDVAGLVTEYAYDGLYRVSRKTFPQDRPGGDQGRYDERYAYDRVGNRTRFEDANGHVTVTEYDGLNRVVRVTRDAGGLGLVATTAYQDPEGSRVNKSEEHDASTGLRTAFTYDRVNREAERAVALEGPGGEGAVYTTQTTYHDGDHAVEVRDPRLKVTRVLLDGLDREVERLVDVGGLELQTSRRHDAAGQVAIVTDARRNPSTVVSDALGRVRETTDAEGFVARFAYDGEGLKTLEVDRRGVSKRFTHDNLGRPRVTEVLPAPALSNLGQRTEILYDDVARTRTLRNARLKDTVQHLDGMDRVVRDVGPDGAAIVRTWDGVNKLSETDRRGNRTALLYDGIDRLRQATDPIPFQAQTVVTTYVDGANRVEEKDRRGIVTVRQFDPLGRVRSVTRDGVLLEEHAYDGNGNKVSSRDADGRETRFEYDGANRLSAQVVGFGTGDASRTEYSHDANGSVTEERDARALARGPGAFSARRTYFKADRLKTEQDGLGNQTEHVYDGEGNRTLLRSPRQTETQYAYDEVGKLLAVTQPVPGPSLERPVTRYAYDANRNLERQEDAGGAVVTLSYDDMDRLTLRRQDPAGLDLRAEIEAYDHDGNVLRLKDANGQVVVSTYDELGRLDTKAFSAIVGAVEPWRQPLSEAYAYDANGNVKSIVESVASGTDPPLARTTTRTHDSLDRLESETTTLAGAGSKHVSYSYFASGLRKTVTSPEGVVTRHTYDGQGRHRSATVADGAPEAETTTYGYHPNGLLHTVATPNGVVATYLYDDADRLLSVVNAAGSEPLSSFVYTYDVNGSRLTQEERHGPAAAESTSYAYDGLDRLAAVTYPERSVAYEYDGAGNRERETETVAGVVVSDRRGTFDGANRLTTLVDSVSPSRSVSFGWDANGNQISKTEAGVTTDFVFDVRDKLVEVQSPAGVLARFTYDAEGRRTQKIGEDGIRHYVYDDTSLYAEYDQSGLAVARYDYGSDRLITLWRADEGRRFFSLDALNSVVSLTGESGDLISSYHLDAWGNYRNPAELEASKNRFGFTGHLFDRETGTYYAKARYFDPGLGRFLSQDSYLGEIDNPPSIHRYAWAHNRPTVFVDPSGNIAVLSDFQKRIDGLRQEIVDVGTDFAEYAGRNQALRMLGLDRKIAEGTGRLAGVVGAAGDAIGATNFAVNLGVLRFAETSTLGKEAAVELGESISAVEQTWNVVSTDPLGVAGRLLNSAQETTEAAMRGDHRAIAEVNEQAARIAVDLALGSKGTAATARGAREAAESAAKRLRPGSGSPVAPSSGVGANRTAGNAARDFIANREAPALIEQNLRTTGGLRRLDVLKQGEKLVGIESKVGRTGLSARVRQELARDLKLLRSVQLDKVRWEFWKSARTGDGGPNAALRQKLEKFGIEILEHDKSF